MPSYRWPTNNRVVGHLSGPLLGNPNASLSEGGALAVVMRDFPEMAHQTRNGMHFPRPLRNSDARLSLACPPPARRVEPHGCQLIDGFVPSRFVAIPLSTHPFSNCSVRP